MHPFGENQVIKARYSSLVPLFVAAQFLAGAHATEPFLGPELQAKVDSVALGAISKGTAAGIAVGLVRGGQLVFNRGYGSANLELNVPVNNSTVFRLASITKQFTAASVLLLAEQHKLSLDDNLTKFYPDFPRGKQITLRHLLNHTSGIRDYTEVNLEALARERWTVPKFAQYIGGLGFDFDPGTQWHYSNSGYYLLGHIIEIVSGKSFAQFTKANLFDRLGMMDTSVDDEADVVPFRAAGYSAAKDRAGGFVNAPYIPMSIVFAAGATRSTVSDMAKWNVALFGGKVLSADSFKVMMEPGRLNNGKLASGAIFHPPGEEPRPPHPGFGPMGYTMGLHTGTLDGHRFMGHEGGIFGFSTIIENYLDDGFMLIIFANTEGGAGQLEMDTARLLFAIDKRAGK
jgi:D-alanyl-D-alanine carboxypeptidase